MVTCGFCGRPFRGDQAQPVCGMCPLAGGCGHLRCPHCGYENPATPRWLRPFQHRDTGDPRAEQSVPLTDLGTGRVARVARLDRPADAVTAHLVALGLLPGTELKLLQRFPAFVVEIGRSQFAIDSELAGRVQVTVR